MNRFLVIFKFCFLFLLLLCMVSCRQASKKSSVTGTLVIAETNDKKITDNYVYLKPVLDEAATFAFLVDPIETNGDILTKTLSDGSFEFEAVPDGKYYLVVWSPFNWILVRQKDSNNPIIISMENKQVIDLGTMNVEWP